jgi:hypothetical protein
MRERGRVYWAAPRSQWYAEPKRLAGAGLLDVQAERGVTGPRRRYRLTETARGRAGGVAQGAVGAAAHPERVGRARAGRGAAESPQDVRRSLDGLREDIADARAHVAAAEEVAQRLPDRRERLLANHRMSTRLLDALAEWADEIDAVLAREPPRAIARTSVVRTAAVRTWSRAATRGVAHGDEVLVVARPLRRLGAQLDRAAQVLARAVLVAAAASAHARS